MTVHSYMDNLSRFREMLYIHIYTYTYVLVYTYMWVYVSKCIDR